MTDPETGGWTDSHCHLAADEFGGDVEDVLARARAAGVTRAVVIGTSPEDSRDALELAARATTIDLAATAGLHPHVASRFDDDCRAALAELCAHDDCAAVGETGLDLFKEWSPIADQSASFDWHLALAKSLDKPVVIHSRDAHEETAALVEAHPGVRGVMHCFAMGASEMTPYLDAGLFISFSGMVTFPRSDAIREAALACPLDRMLVETDAPYLAPVPHRGERCEPAFCADTVRFVAELRGMDADELGRVTSANAAALFGLA